MGNEVIKAIIWDMGGVLIRTEDRGPRDRLARKYGVTTQALEREVFHGPSGIQATLGEITSDEHWLNVAKKLNLDRNDLKSFISEFWRGDRLDQDLVAYIRDLKGKYRSGLLSNAWSDTRKMLTHQHPCLDAFHEAVFSAEVGLMKPDAKIYQLILKKLGTAPETSIFVDDFPENIDGANAIGMHGILFTNPAQVISEIDMILN